MRPSDGIDGRAIVAALERRHPGLSRRDIARELEDRLGGSFEAWKRWVTRADAGHVSLWVVDRVCIAYGWHLSSFEPVLLPGVGMITPGTRVIVSRVRGGVGSRAGGMVEEYLEGLFPSYVVRLDRDAGGARIRADVSEVEYETPPFRPFCSYCGETIDSNEWGEQGRGFHIPCKP